jgi:anaerobic magnesium-protoporphyrin IX monomethyl ester cyclase
VKGHVTLVNPPYPSGSHESMRTIPLGLGYLAAVLENNGYSVDVIDCQVLKPTRIELENKLAKLEPDVVGVTSATLTYGPALEIVKTTKEVCPNCLTVLGGPHVTVMDEHALNEEPTADIVVRGEGEQTMLELANLTSKGNLKNLSEVAGLTFRKNGQIIRTPDRPFIQNIDDLPRPAYRHFQLSDYKISGKIYLPVITSRGCPFQCAFCLVSRMCGNRFRGRSPKNVVDELEWLRDTYEADAFSFYDDTFTFDKKRASEICHEMKKRNVNLPWDCRTRVDRVTRELLADMRNANCQLIHFGIESGSQKMLEIMKKGTTVEQNEKAIKLAKEVGLSSAISVVIGYPGETPELLKQTINFIRKTKPDYVYMCVAIPYPGTELYNLLKDLGWDTSKDWKNYDEQNPTQVFKNQLLSSEKIDEVKKKFYDQFFSPSYILYQSLKRDSYSQTMARIALNHFLWRTKLPRLLPSNLMRQKKRQGSKQPNDGQRIEECVKN